MKMFASLIALALAFAGPASAAQIDIDKATIAEINAAFDAGTLTSEQLVQMYLARIEAYDKQGPKLHAVITLNQKALETARALDAERKAKGKRSLMHGIPVLLKDNMDTSDMPTTGGSVLLEGWIPPKDAFTVKKLRDAGAIILAKVNLSEFATGGANSSLGGQSLNPHDLARTPAGSSGGTGVAVAAAYGQLGFGTDTGGSIRGPSAANGIVGLKTTMGLVSRGGVIPLTLSFDTVGPMARNVSDIAAVLGVITGVDPADAVTKTGKPESDYTKFLKTGAFKGARIGVARDFMEGDAEVIWSIEAAIDLMKEQGATIVDVKFPKWLLDVKQEYYMALRYPEFASQVTEYLSHTGPGYPKSIAELIDRAKKYQSLGTAGVGPNPSRWFVFKREAEAKGLDSYQYKVVKEFGLPSVRAVVNGIFETEKLDAIVYPTSARRPGLTAMAEPSAIGGGGASVIANLSGIPDLIVPSGFTSDDLPIAISFWGPHFSEGKLLSLGYSFEQATLVRRLPVHAPPLAGQVVSVNDNARSRAAN
jgi:amidase